MHDSDPTSDKTSSNFLDAFFTEKQLACELQRSIRTLRRWHVLRVGPPRTSFGRLILYRKTSVAEWLQTQEERLPLRSGQGRRRVL